MTFTPHSASGSAPAASLSLGGLSCAAAMRRTTELAEQGSSRAVELPPQMSYASLGGSNTLGACDTTGKQRCNHTSFARLTFDALTSLGVVKWANGGIGAMGPQLAAACTNKFAPAGTRYATIEYLPNLGYTNDDHGEMAAIEKLLHVLQSRGARVAFVNILPGKAMPRFANCHEREVGCTTHKHIERLHTAIGKLAASYSVPMITMDHDGQSGIGLFGEDKMHLNQAGHAHVHAELMRLYSGWPHWQLGLNSTVHNDDASRAARRMNVACHMGDELAPLIGGARGFTRINFARDPNGRADKIGWEARTAGAALTLCTGFPTEPPVQPKGAREDRPLLSNGGASEYRYVIAVGMQLSHVLNLPLFGVAHVACAGACQCSCKWSHHGAFNESCLYDGLTKGGATVTAFVRMLARRTENATGGGGASGDNGSGRSAGEGRAGRSAARACGHGMCAVTITNSPDVAEPRLRVVVRSLMVGYNQHHSSKWLNTYHLDGTGLTDYRRRRRLMSVSR